MAEQTQVKQRGPAPKVVPGRLVVGIDPDLVKSGIALVRDGRLVELYALGFPHLLEYARQLVDGNALFVVEDVEHDSTTYHRARTNNRAHARIAQNVGQVKGVARVLVECLQHMGADVQQIKPLSGPTKRRAKTDAEYFKKITGWPGRSNADTRDAALLALYGLTNYPTARP